MAHRPLKFPAPTMYPEPQETRNIATARNGRARFVRLKGWAGPKLMLLVRTRAGGSAPMGSNSTTAIHHFAMSPREAEALREGLIALRDDPAIHRKNPEPSRS